MEASDAKTFGATDEPSSPEPSWSALLDAYRLQTDGRWSEILLARLGPWLTNARLALVAAAPYLDEDDIAQELILEVLRMAARWEPQCEDRWIPRKLVEYAERQVRQALKTERKHAGEELSEELEAPATEPILVFDTPLGTASAADLLLIYRVRVLREPVGLLAGEEGISPRQMRHRVRLAIKRARAELPAECR